MKGLETGNHHWREGRINMSPGMKPFCYMFRLTPARHAAAIS